MKSVIGPMFIALVLAAAGGISWAVGHTETRLVDAHKQLATLQYADATAAADAAERTGVNVMEKANMLGLGRRIVALDRSTATDARDLHATADYWRSSYAAIAPQKDASGLVVETDTAILTLAADASFRASQAATDRAESLRKLDVAVKNYAELLKANGGASDAAYNYEFVIRTREALGKPRGSASPKVAARKVEPAGDLPAGPTLHGRPGGPPPATDMNQFRIVIPKRGDERSDAPEAGKGGARIRKG
jgi:hypothetical protein